MQGQPKDLCLLHFPSVLAEENLTLTPMVNDDYALQFDASSPPDHFSLLGIQVLEDRNLVDDH